MSETLFLQLLLAAISQMNAVVNAIKKARAENRDITEAELDAVLAKNEEARIALQAAIDKARSEGR